jgi:hypothetical protein
MRYKSKQRVEVYAHAIRGLRELEPDPEKQRKYMDFIDIYAALDEHELRRFRQEYPEEVKHMTSFEERFLQKGRQEGLQQGLQQGESLVLLRQLTRKFGELPEAERRRIELADSATLLEWADRVVTAATLDEVLH